jgi:ankyrin repeat protein
MLFIQSGATPLHYAADMGHFDVMKLLLNNGANADDRTKVKIYMSFGLMSSLS